MKQGSCFVHDPKKKLWEEADLVVFYLWPREQWDYNLIDACQKL
jgi:hypothetical protein